ATQRNPTRQRNATSRPTRCPAGTEGIPGFGEPAVSAAGFGVLNPAADAAGSPKPGHHFSGNSTSHRSLPSSVIAMTTWSFVTAMARSSILVLGNMAQSWAGPTAFAASSIGIRQTARPSLAKYRNLPSGDQTGLRSVPGSEVSRRG